MYNVLIDKSDLRIKKVAFTVRQLEYWAELLCKDKDFVIIGSEKRWLSTFNIMELSWIYLKAKGHGSSHWRDYGQAISAVSAVIEDMPRDDTPVEALQAQLGYEAPSFETPPGLLDHPPAHRALSNELDMEQQTATGAEFPADAGKSRKRRKAAESDAPKAPRAPVTPSTRPKPGSSTGRVWDIADAVLKKSKLDRAAKELRTAVIAQAVEQGINKNTASVQFGKWRDSPSGLLPN